MIKKIIFFVSVIILFMSCNNYHSIDNVKVSYIEFGVPNVFFPPLILTNLESHVSSQIFEGLLSLEPSDMRLWPQLATNWVENSSKNRITFHIRKNVYFHQDTCFHSSCDRLLTAYDVKSSIEQTIYFKAKNKLSLGLLSQIVGVNQYLEDSIMDYSIREITGIVVEDSLTVSINIKDSNPAFKFVFANQDMKIMPALGLKAYGENCKIGTGPFRLNYFSKDSAVMLRNDNYYLKDDKNITLPYLDEVVVLFEPVPQKALRMLQNDQVDFLLQIEKKFVSVFVENNIELFESKPPVLVLNQPVGVESSTLFMIRKANVIGIRFNFMNRLDLRYVHIKVDTKTLE